MWSSEELSSNPGEFIQLTSTSFTRWWPWLNYMYNMMGAQHGCHAVKLDSCNDLLYHLFIHTVRVIILRSVSLNIKRKYI